MKGKIQWLKKQKQISVMKNKFGPLIVIYGGKSNQRKTEK